MHRAKRMCELGNGILKHKVAYNLYPLENDPTYSSWEIGHTLHRTVRTKSGDKLSILVLSTTSRQIHLNSIFFL